MLPRRILSSGHLLILAVMMISAVHLQAGENTSAGESLGKIKDWSFGYSFVHLKSESGQTYGIHSPAFNYYTRNGRKIAIITNTSILVPVGISYDGDFIGNLNDYYSSTLGIDFAIGFELGRDLGDIWRLRMSPAWNIIGFSLPGKTGYYPFQSLTTGPALNFILERDWEQGINVRIGLYTSFQAFDLIHTADKLENGYSIQLNVGLGFRDGSAFGRVDYE